MPRDSIQDSAGFGWATSPGSRSFPMGVCAEQRTSTSHSPRLRSQSARGRAWRHSRSWFGAQGAGRLFLARCESFLPFSGRGVRFSTAEDPFAPRLTENYLPPKPQTLTGMFGVGTLHLDRPASDAAPVSRAAKQGCFAGGHRVGPTFEPLPPRSFGCQGHSRANPPEAGDWIGSWLLQK